MGQRSRKLQESSGALGPILGAPTERGGRGRMLPEEEAAVQRGFYPESSRSQLLAFNFEK